MLEPAKKGSDRENKDPNISTDLSHSPIIAKKHLKSVNNVNNKKAAEPTPRRSRRKGKNS